MITQGRGESRTDVFDSEAAAVAHLARASLGRPVTHVPPEELAEARAATQRRAQATLAQMRAARECLS